MSDVDFLTNMQTDEQKQSCNTTAEHSRPWLLQPYLISEKPKDMYSLLLLLALAFHSFNILTLK